MNRGLCKGRTQKRDQYTHWELYTRLYLQKEWEQNKDKQERSRSRWERAQLIGKASWEAAIGSTGALQQREKWLLAGKGLGE